MTKRRPLTAEMLHDSTVEVIERLAAMASDPDLDVGLRMKAAHTLIDVGWGPLPPTWRDWIRHPIRSFRRWRRWL